MNFNHIKTVVLSKENIFSYIAGIIFVTVFMWGYSHIENNWYEFRDDGLITMSTAKNLVDAGFIGVSISGPIVEASSSPLQVFIYSISYLVTGVDYADYSYWQTLLSTFFIGFLFAKFFVERPMSGIVATTLSAIGLTWFYPFFEWHASGMENAITHLLFLATFYILYKSIKESQIIYWYALIVFMATIVRLDSVYHIGSLLVIYSIYWFLIHKNFKAFNFSLIVFGLWLAFQFGRYYYFGDILPNTAYAQGISLESRLHMLMTLDSSYLTQSFSLANEIFMQHGGWLLIIVFPLLYFFKLTRSNVFILILSLCLIFTSYFNPFLFGETRIDIARTTTQMTLIIFLLLSFIYLHSHRKKVTNIILIAFLPFLVMFYSHQELKAYFLGWSTKAFDTTRIKLLNIAKENNISRPTISNPDLGVMSWYKQFNIIDLGMLGSPIMAKLVNGSQVSKYYLDYGLPDIIESHGAWTRKYCRSIFLQDKFNRLYSQIGTNYDLVKECSDKDFPPRIFWIRNDIKKESKSNERLFLDRLQKDISLESIQSEMKHCKNKGEKCSYIARTVYKFIPELREKKLFDEVYMLFDVDTDKALLRGWKDGQADKVIIEAVLADVYYAKPIDINTDPIGNKIQYSIDMFIDQPDFMRVQGWAFKKNTNVDRSSKYIVLRSDFSGFTYSTVRQRRKDVTKYYKAENLDNSGFGSIIDKRKLPHGIYEVFILLEDESNETQIINTNKKITVSR